ncbi:hypothetical protein DITRI_Ditri09bG0037800 [Diplodiscus trichospermus]
MAWHQALPNAWLIESIKLKLAIWGKAKWPMVKESVLDVISPNIVRVPIVHNPGLVGIEGVLRDYRSNVKAVFSKSIRATDSNLAQLIVIKEALSLSISSQWALFCCPRTSGVVCLVGPLGIAVGFRRTASVQFFATMNFHYGTCSSFF